MLHTTTGIIEDLFICSIISNQAEIIKISICFETLERLNITAIGVIWFFKKLTYLGEKWWTLIALSLVYNKTKNVVGVIVGVIAYKCLLKTSAKGFHPDAHQPLRSWSL